MSDGHTMGSVSWSPDFKSGPGPGSDQIKRLLTAHAARSEQQVQAALDDKMDALGRLLAPVSPPIENDDKQNESETIRLVPGPNNLGVEIGFTYVNWKGETSERRAVFTGLIWGKNEWHPTPQLLLEGYDLDKKAPRTFAAKDISNLHLL